MKGRNPMLVALSPLEWTLVGALTCSAVVIAWLLLVRRPPASAARRDGGIERLARLSEKAGHDYFESLVHHLASTLDADYAFVGALDLRSPSSVETVATFAEGKLVDNFTYALAGTPCENIIGQSICVYADAVQDRFPDDRLLVDMGVRSYAGTPLFASSGEALGLLVVLFRRSIPDASRTRALLQIFAARASAELERVQMEQALRESEENLRALITYVPFSICRLDREGRVLSINPAGLANVGETDETRVVGTHFAAALHIKDEEDVREALADALRGNSVEMEFEQRDGTLFEGRFVPITQPSGAEGKSVLALAVDITEHRASEHEREALQTQLLSSQKTESVGTLAAGLAHDFNNVLTAILAHVDLLDGELSSNSAARKAVDGIKLSVKQATAVTRGLMTFSRKASSERRPHELRAVLRDALQVLERSLPASIELDVRMPDEEVWADVDETQVQQVIFNLAINARQAMPKGGRLAISLCSPDALRSPRAESPRRLACVCLEDTGSGMPQEIRERAFDPFFTTKSRGEGTGLGLAIVHGIVTSHGGQIEVDSEPGKGTRFRIMFPLTERPAETRGSSARDPIPAGEGQQVLLAEDNRQVRAILVAVLHKAGYDVIQVADGLEAVDTFKRLESSLSLVILDADLPGMGGLDCLQAIHGTRPEIPAIVISGLPEEDILGDLDAIFLPKPFEMSRLVRVVGEALRQNESV